MAGRHGKTVVGVLTVIDEEFRHAQAALEATNRWKGTAYWHSDLGPDHFVLRRLADRSNVAAGQGTTKLIEHWQPDVVVLLGIAGGIDGAGPGLGDVVLPDYIHYAEFRKLAEGADNLRYAAYDQPTVSLREEHTEGVMYAGTWTSRLSESRPNTPPRVLQALAPWKRAPEPKPRAHMGAIVATEKVLGDPDHPEQERLFMSFDHAIAVDMESFGVARAVHEARFDAGYNPRLAIVRGVSDLVRPKKHVARRVAEVQVNNEERKRWKNYAAASASAFARELVSEICL